MFYEQLVLAKKGPLGNVWLAAHWEKKLTKLQIVGTDVKDTVERITNPRAPMALRLSGHLLLGVVRIYSRKVEYLYTDCSEALVKIKMAFRPGVVDMEQSTANTNAITMPETFGDFEILLPSTISSDLLPEAEEGLFTLNVAKAVDITIAPEHSISAPSLGSSQLNLDSLSQADVSLINSEMNLLPTIGADLNMADAFDLPDAGFAPPPLTSFDDPEIPFESSSSSEKVLQDLRALERPDEPTRLKNKHYKVDKSLQLTLKSVQKYQADPKALTRTLHNAPVLPQFREARMVELNKENFGFLLSASSFPVRTRGLAPALTKVLERPIIRKDSLGLPLQLDDEDVEAGRFGSTIDSARDDTGSSGMLDIPGDFGQFGDDWSQVPMLAEGDLPNLEGEQDAEVGKSKSRDKERSRRKSSIADAETEADTQYDISDFGTQEGTVDRDKSFVVTKRTAAMHEFIKKKVDAAPDGEVQFSQLVAGKKQRTVAIAFFELLGIKSKNCIDLRQAKPYADITISPTQFFDSLKA